MNIRSFALLVLVCVLSLSQGACLAQKQAISLNTPEASKMDVKSSKSSKGPSLSLDSKKFKQGDFIRVVIQNAKSKPTVWFNTKAYKPFKVSKNTYRALVPVENLTKPGTYSVLARDGKWEEKIKVKVLDNKKRVEQITLSSNKSGLSATSKEINSIGSAFKTKSNDKYWQGKFIYPSKARRSSPFGIKRSYNGGPVESYHKGLDFAGAKGSAVVAPAEAKVVMVGYENSGFVVHGNSVVLDHGHGVTSIYMHLSKIDVKKGQKVKQGQKIGEVGHTGISTGPHLHWGIYLYGTSVDPETFVARIVE